MTMFRQPTYMPIITTDEQQSPRCLPDDLVADHLASQLRSSRLTVLYSGPANSVEAFIAAGVSPRLGRRQWDRRLTRIGRDEPTPTVPGAVASRRQSIASAELVVLVDRWTGPPTATLQKRINESFESAGAYMTSISLPVANSLSAWSQLLDLRFLIILDRFEEFLAGCAESDDGRRFTDELVQVLREPGLAVNFLICASDRSEPELQRYQTQFGQLEQTSCVRVPLHRSSVPASVSDLTLIEWREPPFARQLATSNANPDVSADHPLREVAKLHAAYAATIAAIVVFCWPALQPDIHFDAAGYLTLAARAVERRVSELYHRIEDSVTRAGLCSDSRSTRCDATSDSP